MKVRMSLILLSVLLIAVLLLGSFGCSKSTVLPTQTATQTPTQTATQTPTQTATPTPTSAQVSLQGKTVMFSPLTFAIQYWRNVVLGMKSVFDPLGINLLQVDPNADVSKQSSDIETAISERVNAIIVSALNERALDNVINEANKAGIITHSAIEGDTLPATILMSYHNEWLGWEMGSRVGQYIRDNMGGNATIGYLDAPTIPTCVAQFAAQKMAILYYAPNAKFIRAGGTVTETDAYTFTEDVMTAHPEISVLTSLNDDSAFGQIGALQAMHRTDVKVFGIGDQLLTYQAVKAGTQPTNTGTNSVDAGVRMANDIVMALSGEHVYKYQTDDSYTQTPQNVDYLIAERTALTTGQPAPVPPRAGEVKKIGISIPSSDEFWTNVEVGVRKELAQKYAGVTLEAANAAGNSAQQVSDIGKMISDGCEAIIIAPVDPSALTNVVTQAQQAGVYTVGFNMTPPFMTYGIDTNPTLTGVTPLDTSVKFMPNTKWRGQIAGQDVGNYILNNMGGSGQVALLEEANDLSLHDSMLWCNATISLQAPNAEVVAWGTASTEVDATATMNNILAAHPGTKIVVAATDNIAYGVVDALKAAGRTDIKVWTLGSDNTRTLQLIQQGSIYMSLPLVSVDTGMRAGDAAVQLAEGVPVNQYKVPSFDEVTSADVGWYLSMRQQDLTFAK